MKNIFNRILSLMLCLVICMTMGGFSAPIDPSDADNSVVVLSTSYDPIYGAGKSSIVKVEGADLPKPSVTVSSYAEAIKYARAELVKKSGKIAVTYRETAYINQAYVNKILEDIYAHTGNPKEGDYLKFQIAISSVIAYSGSNVAGSSKTIYLYLNGPDADYSSSPAEWPKANWPNIVYYYNNSQDTEVDAAVAKLIDELGVRNMERDYDKIQAVYNWICWNVKYDYDHLNMGTSYLLQYTAYAALVQRTAVCQGYANLFYRMMLELGIDCRIIGGTSHGEGHAWNIVKLGDLYYNIDTTWGAGSYDITRYFLKGSNNFPDHTRDPEYTTSAFNAAYPMSPNDFYPDWICYHDGEWVVVNEIPATCIDEGYSGELICSLCGEVMRKGTFTLANGHTNNGTGICPDCGEPFCYSHKYDGNADWIDNQYHGERCTICGYFHRTYHWSIDHDTELCLDCGGETNFKVGDHDVYIVQGYNRKKPTCEEDGYTGDVFCAACSRILEYGEVIPKLEGGHDYVDGVCTKCGDICYHYHRDYDNRVNVKEPTCTQPGYTGDIVCLDCGKEFPTGYEIPALGHEFNDEGVCERCGFDKSNLELGDINGDGKVDVQDGVLMQRILANLETNEEYILRADLNNDGGVSVQDGVKMQRILANLE